jgi:hypothetical protein
MTPSSSAAPDAAAKNVFIKMLPITLAVFIAFLTIGLPLPVLPLHLHYTLGMSNLVVGIAIGVQFFAALLSRAWAICRRPRSSQSPQLRWDCCCSAGPCSAWAKA